MKLHKSKSAEPFQTPVPPHQEQDITTRYMQRADQLTSMALSLANELTRMETNISRMDPSIKGYKQLQKSVERMKIHFSSCGINIVSMLGQPYDVGLRADAEFVTDESLPMGTQIITSVMRPQINIGGMMIQKAEIIVSQNLGKDEQTQD